MLDGQKKDYNQNFASFKFFGIFFQGHVRKWCLDFETYLINVIRELWWKIFIKNIWRHLCMTTKKLSAVIFLKQYNIYYNAKSGLLFCPIFAHESATLYKSTQKCWYSSLLKERSKAQCYKTCSFII